MINTIRHDAGKNQIYVSRKKCIMDQICLIRILKILHFPAKKNCIKSADIRYLKLT